MQMSGKDVNLRVRDDGKLEVKENIVMSAPKAWQIIDGEKKNVEVEFSVDEGNVYGFAV
jgi:hypothetical protein